MAHDGHASTDSSTLRLHITTLGRSALPRLPAWTESPATAQVFGLDAYYHDVYATTYLDGGALSLTAWTRQRWRFAVTQVVGPNSTGAVKTALGSMDLPGRGALLWNNPNDWTVTSTWCTRGQTYHLAVAWNSAAAARVAEAGHLEQDPRVADGLPSHWAGRHVSSGVLVLAQYGLDA